MVIESLLNPLDAQKNPGKSFLLGVAAAIIGLLLAIWVFEDHAGLVAVFLIVMATLPFFLKTVYEQEKKDFDINDEKQVLREHGKAASFLMLMFIGITLALTVMYVIMPATTANDVFSAQTKTISSINQKVTGDAVSTQVLSKIFLNNMKVMIFSILFSFIFGSGAIFILAWNASVISVALGNFIRTKLADYTAAVGLQKTGGYLYVFSLSLFRYSIHGIPEVMAYFTAGIAGGILSVALIQKHYQSERFEKILLDVSDLIVVSVIILFVAAVLEVYVTPIFFH